MKRYIYILLSAIVMLCACEPGNQKPDVAFCFTPVEISTTDTTATITNRSYMTIDGVRYDAVNFHLEYTKMEEDKYVRGGDFTRLSDGWFEFLLTDLNPNTAYKARIVIDGGEHGAEAGSPFPFTTQERVVTESISCKAEVDAKGLYATVKLSDVAYLVDDVAQNIASVRVEYRGDDIDEWSYVEIAGKDVKNGKVDITIPKSSDNYLIENKNYSYHITITPESGDYKAMTTDDFTFKTKFAVPTAEFAKPKFSYSDEGLSVEVSNVEIFYDGLSKEEYTPSYTPIFFVYYKATNSVDWQYLRAESYGTGLKVTIPANMLTKGVSYEIISVALAGAENTMLQSSVAGYTIPADDTPSTPILPEPPTGGDTSAIEGVWHLTEWRGATPPFEVYMEITANGGINLYQRIESNYWEVFQSSAYINDGIISGTYTDGASWGASYAITTGDNTMTWVDTTDSNDISVYTRSELPHHMPMAPTRSSFIEERFL